MTRVIELNGRKIALTAEAPTGADLRHAADVDPARLLIDARTREIVRPEDLVAGDDFIDAPRFDKGTP